MEIVFYILIAMSVLGLIVFFVGIKNAQTVDDKEPFLRGDYDPNKYPNASR